MSPTLLAQIYFGVNFKVDYVLVTLTPLSRIMNGWEYTAVRLEEKAMSGGGGDICFLLKNKSSFHWKQLCHVFCLPFQDKIC